MSGTTQYLHQLTWLRGFAAFLVVISHTIRATEVSYTGNEQAQVFALAKFFDLGNFGVILFFTLSGATLYISSKGSLTSTPKFYVKRFFRIWPAFIVSLIAYIAFAFVFKNYYHHVQGRWIEQQFLADYGVSDLIAYLTLTFNYYATQGLFNNAYWSLPIEFQYYLLFPLLLIALTRVGILGPILIGAALLGIHMVFDMPERSSAFFRLGYSFCGGVVLGYLYNTLTVRLPATVGVIILLLGYPVVYSLTWGGIALPDFPLMRHIWNWYVLFAFIFMGVCMFTKFTLPKTLQHWLEVYGSISYSTYLFHNLVIGALVLLLIHLHINNGVFRYLFMLIGTLCLTHLLALNSYRFIELPFIKLARQWVNR